MKQMIICFFALSISCESYEHNPYTLNEKYSTKKEIINFTIPGFTTETDISDEDDIISVTIQADPELLKDCTADVSYRGFALLKDGIPQTNTVTRNDFSNAATEPALYTVVAEDKSTRDYRVFVYPKPDDEIDEETSCVTNLIITEWGDAGTDIDYIEIKNFGKHPVYLPDDLTIHYGINRDGSSPQTSACLTGYCTDESNWVPIPQSGVRIEPSEFILLVDYDLDTPIKIDDFRYMWGSRVDPPFKLFRSTGKTTLIGIRERLSYSPAWLSSGGLQWSRTPHADIDDDGKPLDEPEHFAYEVGTSTYSSLNMSHYTHGISATDDFSVWSNGTRRTHSTPGGDFSQ